MLEIKQLTRLQIIRYCEKLEEENRKLREQLIQRNMQNDNLGRKNKELEEENGKLKLHIEAKDKSYLALCKDYERIKDDNVKLREKIKQWVKVIEQSLI